MPVGSLRRLMILAGFVGLPAAAGLAAEPQTSFRFSFGPERQVSGFTGVRATDAYKKGGEKAWGFEETAALKEVSRAGQEPLKAGFITSEAPFYFSVAVPEGNYRVTVTAGDAQGPTNITVKAELRRLMVEKVSVESGAYASFSFVVNVRVPRFAGGSVRLKAPRETVDEAWAWDEKLTLEFNNSHPNICGVEIEKVDVPTVYLLGDSTVCDQAKEPWNSWGQMFPRFFKDTVAVANHGQSGETVASSLGALRFNKVWSAMKPGDYLFFAFGHNDMKVANNLEPYKAAYRRVIQETRAKGGIPVVVSSVERKSGINASTLAGYPEAARAVAEEEKAPFIDLHAMSQQFYKGLGPELNLAFQDGTHHNNFGSYEVSKLVLEGVRRNNLDLVRHIRAEVPAFDPARPGKAADYKVPASPNYTNTRPLGD